MQGFSDCNDQRTRLRSSHGDGGVQESLNRIDVA
jgi:hypothetical protein